MAHQYPRETETTSRSQPNFYFIPATVSMILNLKESPQPEIQRTTYIIVARVKDYDSNEMLLCDETGSIKGKIFKSRGKSIVHAIQDYQYRPNHYATVVGHCVISQDTDIYINVTKMTNITSYKEINFHRAQIVWSLLIKNSVLKVPETQIENVKINAESEENPVMRYIRTHSRGGAGIKIDEIKKGVKLNPFKIENMLQELVDNGYLSEFDGSYQITS